MPGNPSLKLQAQKWFQERDSLVQSRTGTLDLELPKKHDGSLSPWTIIGKWVMVQLGFNVTVVLSIAM